MKLVSDFDGVWTLPDAEAQAQGEILDHELEAALPRELRDRGREWIGRARAAVAASPQRYGWALGGRISAFGDEDPFTAHSALMHYIQQATGDPMAAAIRLGVEAGGRTLDETGAASHAAGVARVGASRGPPLGGGGGEAGRALLAAGAEVVIVSNSPSEKLGAWFAHAGLAGVAHPERAAHAFRFRGASRKFETDSGRAHPLVLGGIRIETARPAYEAILREEKPDAVVGDVFSLDLALPLRLKREAPGWRNLRVLWIMQPYTPRWLRAAVEWHAGCEVECVEGGIAAVTASLLAA